MSQRLPPAIWTLGFVSLLMDISSEMIHALLPVFLTTVLAASALKVGLIEGAAEATALAVKVFSGVWSDRLGRRKPLALAGYGLGALSKPLFALATGAGFVFAARFIDRIGKGLRGAPRDALVAELAPAKLRGAAFGLRQSLDTVGAFAGPLLAAALMLLWADDFRAVFWVAVVPGMLALALLAFGVKEPRRDGTTAARLAVNPLRRDQLARLPRAYWAVIVLGGTFSLARFSEAFLVLRAQQAGLPVALAPLVLVGMNGVYALTAYPAGRLADQGHRKRLLLAGLAALVAADVVLASAGGAGPPIALGIGLWGLHMGLTQGLLAAMVADAAPADRLGTAYGMFNLVCGLGLLVASVFAGLLWDHWGAGVTFAAGAVLAGLAFATALVMQR
jgi:MFS family permease